MRKKRITLKDTIRKISSCIIYGTEVNPLRKDDLYLKTSSKHEIRRLINLANKSGICGRGVSPEYFIKCHSEHFSILGIVWDKYIIYYNGKSIRNI